MRKLKRFVLIFLLSVLAFAPEVVHAQSAELMAAFKQCQKLEKAGKYAEALPFTKMVIELVIKEFGESHQYYATGLNNLASLYDKRERKDKAKS